MSNAQSQRTVKKRRSLKRPDFTPKKRVVDPNSVLPIDIDADELEGIMRRVATGEEDNPQAVYARIYSLAVDSIAETLKGALTSLVNSAASAEMSPVVSQFLPLTRDPQAMAKIAESISQKIDASKEQIRKSFEKMGDSAKKRPESYNEFARSLHDNKILNPLINHINGRSSEPQTSADRIMPGHITAERLREICDDLKHFKPEKEARDRFKIDLSKLPDTVHFNVKADKPKASEQATAQAQQTTEHDDVTCGESTEQSVVEKASVETEAVSDVADQVLASDVVEDAVVEAQANAPRDVVENSDAAIQPLIVEQSAAASNDEAQAQDLSSEATAVIPQAIEQAFLQAAIANQTGLPFELDDKTGETLKQFGVEFAQTFDGFTSMLSEFANQLAAAIIEDQASRLPTLTEALENDPRMADDDELKDFISFLDSDTTDDSSEELDNAELAAAFESLLGNFN